MKDHLLCDTFFHYNNLVDLILNTCHFPHFQICSKVRNENWQVVNHPDGAMGPYAFRGTQWVGYDDVATIRRKSEFIKAEGYGGGMIWALDLDDFRNVCGCEKYPLLRTINRVLRDYPSPGNC